MCLLTFLPPGVPADPWALHTGAAHNRDGHGFALITRSGGLYVRHGLTAPDMIDQFLAARAAHPDGPALFHSRLATHGDAGLDNCHPFPVGGDPRTVLAHNGVLPAEVQPSRGDPRSDTRIAAEEFLPTLGPLYRRAVRLRAQRWMTPANKMVILTVNRRYRQQAYLLHEDEGIWDNGIWYSNTGYQPAPPRTWPPDDWPPYDRCAACGSIVDILDGVCDHCGRCLDCGQHPGHCLCYRPPVRCAATGSDPSAVDPRWLDPIDWHRSDQP